MYDKAVIVNKNSDKKVLYYIFKHFDIKFNIDIFEKFRSKYFIFNLTNKFFTWDTYPFECSINTDKDGKYICINQKVKKIYKEKYNFINVNDIETVKSIIESKKLGLL